MFTTRLSTLARSVRRPLLLISQPSKFTAARALLTTSSAAPAAHSPDEHGAAAGDHGHDDHGSHYDPPGGWLWGLRPGEKYEKEGWEDIFYYGFFGSFIVAGIAYAFKEDTSIQTWALEEARRRLEKEGILEDPEKSS